MWSNTWCLTVNRFSEDSLSVLLYTCNIPNYSYQSLDECTLQAYVLTLSLIYVSCSFRVTEQLMVWMLIVLSLVAICACDVIKYPFNPNSHEGWHCSFVEVIFALNIGRYLFSIIESLLSKHHIRKVKFRTDLIHHAVAVMCYSFFLAYAENMLLGLIGVLIETTTVFDEIGRALRDSEKTDTVCYKRLVIISCVLNVCFRGLLPTVFLVIAMFQQSPFTMNNLTLMVFFLSMIFFSVINVWQILSSIQRLLKYTVEQSRESYQCARDRTVERGRSRQLRYSKNNLGYLRPYNNKNLAYQNNNEKDNLNNRKDTAKETFKLHLDPASYYSETKFGVKDESSAIISGEIESDQAASRAEIFLPDFESFIHLQNTKRVLTQHPLRVSNNSTMSSDTARSDTLFTNNLE